MANLKIKFFLLKFVNFGTICGLQTVNKRYCAGQRWLRNTFEHILEKQLVWDYQHFGILVQRIDIPIFGGYWPVEMRHGTLIFNHFNKQSRMRSASEMFEWSMVTVVLSKYFPGNIRSIYTSGEWLSVDKVAYTITMAGFSIEAASRNFTFLDYLSGK